MTRQPEKLRFNFFHEPIISCFKINVTGRHGILTKSAALPVGKCLLVGAQYDHVARRSEVLLLVSENGLLRNKPPRAIAHDGAKNATAKCLFYPPRATGWEKQLPRVAHRIKLGRLWHVVFVVVMTAAATFA